MKKRKFEWQKWLPVIIMAFAGGICGFLFTDYAARTGDFGKKLIELPIFFVGMYAAIYLQLVLHEAGHLVFGLISGYSFVSFRVGSFMLVKQSDGVRLKRQSIAGTGGQCLLSPPALADGKMPVVLYNLGGVIVNAVSAALLYPVYLSLGDSALSLLLLIIVLMGVALALVNGVPMRLAQVDNDGRNALELAKDKTAQRGFWIQLTVNAELAKGKRLRELPQEWFALPADEELQNSMCAAVAVIACNRLMDEARLADADALMNRLLSMETGMAGLHREMLRADTLFCELLNENRKEVIEQTLDKPLKSIMKAMRKMPPIIRTQYALALLHERDEKKAKKLLLAFDKAAKTYPYSGDIQGERELLQLARERFAQTQHV